MLNTLIQALLPVVVTLALGVVAGWRGDQDVKGSQALNAMVLTYALPMMLFAATAQTSRAKLIVELPLGGCLAAGLVIPYVLALAVSRLVLRRSLSDASLTALSLGFPAIPGAGLAVLKPLIGVPETGAVLAWGGIIINALLLPATMTMLAFERERARGSAVALGTLIGGSLSQAFREPVVIAPLVGVALILADVEVPPDVVDALRLLGSTVSGVALFAAGIILQSRGWTVSLPAIPTSVFRVLVIPGATFAAMASFGADPKLTRMVVLGMALAVTPVQLILAVRFGVGEEENAAVLLYSNVLSILTLGLFIWLTGTA